ncbi:MAG: hypothetical protein ACK4K1_02495 [Flavobacterium sp.]
MLNNLSDTDKRNLKILGAILGTIFLYRYFSTDKDDFGGATDPTGNSNTNVITPGFDAKRVAERLYELMKTMGSENMAIIRVFNNINEAEFGKVRTAFGRRSYNKTLGNQYNFNPFSSLPLEPLEVWLENELSSKEYSVLKLKYPKFL